MSASGVRHVNLRKARESRAVLVSRLSNSVLTDDLESVWPEVAARLAAMLRRRGVRHHDIDEIVQETAARAISTRVPYEDADDLFRWASVVGGRLAIDLRRRGARLSDDELPDRADPVDVAMAAENRIVLGAVRSRLPELSARDQEVLLSSFRDEPTASRRESVRVAVARHRARNRLRLLLDGLAGTAIVGWIRRNRLWAAPVEAISYAATPTAAWLLITVGAWSGVSSAPARDAASPSRPAALIASAPSVSTAPVATTADATPGRSARSTPQPSTVPGLADPYVVITRPDGDHTRVGVRDKEQTDHLWCLTTSPTGAPQETCVDSPVTLPPTPIPTP
jgi:DNA-directed RNA polymerase specialized sigma24 family protein